MRKRHIVICGLSATIIQGEHKVIPDYKHLLQENYVEYKHIFLCHVFIVILQLHMFVFHVVFL
jgi:hypothetical protein